MQLHEAITATGQARDALAQASQHLGDAGRWGTYDTFFGGGLIADEIEPSASTLVRRS